MVNIKDKIFKKKPEEDIDEYALRISALKDTIENATWTTIANIVNENAGVEYSADRYRKQYKRYQNEQDGIEPSQKEDESEYNDRATVTINYDKGEQTSSREIPLTDKQLKDPAELLKAHGYNPDEFELKSATNSKTTRMGVNGKIYVYTSRIIVKQKSGIVSDVKEIAKLFETFKSPKGIGNKNNYSSDEYLVVPLYDLHFGRIPDEEDYKGYNVEDEKNKIINHVRKYIDKFNGRHFNSIYLVIGQDFLNSSFTGFTSSQSHLQSNALDFRTMFRAGSELLISIIDMFAEECNSLKVVGSLGNHSISEEVALFALLSAYYRNCSNIEVDDGTSPRKYFKIGNAGVGVGHLDKESKRAFGLMQVEAKNIWSCTKTHVFIAGHLHHFTVSNENGVELYRVPSICPPDRWTKEQGYVMNEPKTMCFVFDEEEGLIETHFMYL